MTHVEHHFAPFKPLRFRIDAAKQSGCLRVCDAVDRFVDGKSRTCKGGVCLWEPVDMR